MRQSIRLAFFLAAIGVSTLSVHADDRRTDKATVTIMHYNAEFLWDGVEPEEGNATFPWKGSRDEAEQHMRGVAQVIIDNDPDIVNLCEVENIEALNTFNDKFLKGRGYKAYLVNGLDKATGQDVAILTRIDPVGGKVGRSDSFGFSGNVKSQCSKNQIAPFDVGSLKLGLVGLHLLAIPSDPERRAKREAQADVIRKVAVDLRRQGYFPVVLGDFNDYDGGDEAHDHVRSMPISNVMQLVKDMDRQDPADDLYNVAASLAQKDRYTSFWDKNKNGVVDDKGELTSIDHIVIAPELKSRLVSVRIPHDTKPGDPSDHFPVLVRLDTREGSTPTAVPNPTPVPAVGTGNIPAASRLAIYSLLPNPPGNETQEESVTLVNRTDAAINLRGWFLKDRDGHAWRLDDEGEIASGKDRRIVRSGRAMSLNNGGDTIDLIDPGGNVIHTVTYGRADEGEEVFPAR